MTEKIAVIGMGQMGSAMAGRVRESNLDVMGFDVNADQRARLEREGFRMAASIAEAVADRSVVLTSLPDPKAVTEAWLGAGGIVASAAKGAICYRALNDRSADHAQCRGGGGGAGHRRHRLSGQWRPESRREAES